MIFGLGSGVMMASMGHACMQYGTELDVSLWEVWLHTRHDGTGVARWMKGPDAEVLQARLESG